MLMDLAGYVLFASERLAPAAPGRLAELPYRILPFSMCERMGSLDISPKPPRAFDDFPRRIDETLRRIDELRRAH